MPPRTLDPRREDLLVALDKFVEKQLYFLTPVEKCWQPSDLLPNMTSEAWVDEITSLRTAAKEIDDEVLVTLVANMITEEALPSYHAWLSNLETGFDRSGASSGGIARWMRGWVAEEKRHGDALANYLYLCGRVDLRAIEITIQNLLRNGFDPQTDNDIFQAFIYTSFQERATFVAHSGVAKLARKSGDTTLAEICDRIAGDESRHEKAYETFVSHLFELDPDQSMISFERLLRRQITMPARLMSDGKDPDIFALFSAVTQKNGIYTAVDYAKIVAHLVRLWKIETLSFKTPEARAAQEYASTLAERYLRVAERSAGKLTRVPQRPISWINDRTV